MGPHRLLFTNAITMNVGDAAILLGMLESFHDAFGERVHVDVADEAYETVAGLYPGIAFVPPLHGGNSGPSLGRSIRRRRVTAAVAAAPLGLPVVRSMLPPEGRAQLRRMGRADAVIARGGTYLVEYYPIRRSLEEIELAGRTGTPTYLYSQSIGRFTDPATARRVRSVLEWARRIFVRDARSRQNLAAMGVDETLVTVHPDAAFALARAPAPVPPEPLRIAISVRSWRHYRHADPAEGQAAYREAIAQVVRRLVAGGAHVTFLSTCQGRSDYWADDSRYAIRLVAELLQGVPRVEVDGAFRRPREIMDELTRYHVAIATRMHFAILALCAGVPVAPIAYEFKITELFAGLGWGHLVTPLETIDPASLWKSVEAVVLNRADLRSRLAELLPGLREDAGRPAAMIADDVRGMDT